MSSRHECDIVIAGAGASGIAAALTAAEAGRRVILLEKGNKTGGAGLFGSQGFAAFDSAKQIAAGEQGVTVEDGYREMMTYTHHRSNGRITRAVIGLSGDTVDWLEERGLATELVDNTQEVHQGHPRTYHQYLDKFKGYEALFERFAALGGTLLTETACTGLTRDSDGRITGIEAEAKGEAITIAAPAVILATGGYVADPELAEEYLEIDPAELYSMGERKAVGDAQRMAFEAGADECAMGMYELHAASTVPAPGKGKLTGMTVMTLTDLPLLWLDSTGQRFTGEDIVYDFALWGNVTYAAGGFYYALLDAPTVAALRAEGTDMPDSFERTFMGLAHQPPTGRVAPLADIDEALAEAVDKGVAWRADTLEDLAAQIGVPAAALTESVATYNAAVDAGEDALFYKPAKFLKYKVETGPFYALRPRSTTLGTIGGVRVNEKFEAVTPARTPVPGLYVTGNNAGGIYGDSYPTVEGMSAAFAYVSGRIAGAAAADYTADE